MMNKELAYRCQMLPAKIREDRTLAELALLRSGWPQDVLRDDIEAALAWAGSQVLTHKQEKYRKSRAGNKKQKGDDALDAMFASVGANPLEIPRRT